MKKLQLLAVRTVFWKQYRQLKRDWKDGVYDSPDYYCFPLAEYLLFGDTHWINGRCDKPYRILSVEEKIWLDTPRKVTYIS